MEIRPNFHVVPALRLYIMVPQNWPTKLGFFVAESWTKGGWEGSALWSQNQSLQKGQNFDSKISVPSCRGLFLTCDPSTVSLWVWQKVKYPKNNTKKLSYSSSGGPIGLFVGQFCATKMGSIFVWPRHTKVGYKIGGFCKNTHKAGITAHKSEKIPKIQFCRPVLWDHNVQSQCLRLQLTCGF